MTADFQLSSEIGPRPRHREHALFERPSRAQKCRHAIWQILNDQPTEAITLCDLHRDLDFPRSDIYRAAKTLVEIGLAVRREVSWHELLPSGKEKAHHLIGVKVVPIWGHSESRKW